MNDLFEALTLSIRQYMNIDTLTPRRQKTVKDTYNKFVYTPETIDALFDFTKDESDEEK